MRASAESVRPVRDRAAEILGAAQMSRNGRSPSCTATTAPVTEPASGPPGSGRPGSTRNAVSTSTRRVFLPALDELEGFCSASLMVDRGSGRCVASASYDSMEALERNKEQLDSLKTARTQEAGAEVLDECDFELTLAHLRVPEMA